MSLWGWVLLAVAVCFACKLAGHLLPSRLVEDQRVAAVAGSVTIGLLAALVVTQTAATGAALVVDARLPALAAAALALWLRAPFVVVVLVGALVAAGLRVLGWG
ncbi:hypothetical protein GCM10028777_40590 [Angustibacter speluncae]